ncbi:MAG: chaperone modulator CbpM [Salinivirgaceae bacterium]|nr:chaperone modulator CbpM [Salinivirgaceae bacterium]MDY0280519.1 chaperone modulator CbpM [Salinivirgaceae bacterium]
MQSENLIAIRDFCTTHNIEISFVSSLQKNGLIEITTIQETEFIHADQLPHLEKIAHLYFELDINLEGIDTIFHLLQRINTMQDEIKELRNKLRFYEL